MRLSGWIFDDPCLNCTDSHYRGMFLDFFVHAHFIVLISISILFLICIVLSVFFFLKHIKTPKNIFHNLQLRIKAHKSCFFVILIDILWLVYLIYLLSETSMFGFGSLLDWIF